MASPGSLQLNRQSTTRPNAARTVAGGDPIPRDEVEEARTRQLVEVTIDSLAEVGFVGSTLAQIASRADVSPGLVAHYFGDKDGLLEATFRTLSRRLSERVQARLSLARTPRGRIQAVIDANLAPEEFDKRTGTAWLAFWGQVLHVQGLKRIQTVYQRRTLSNLSHALKKLLPPVEARNLAAMIAAMIDGVWLRAALSDWKEADSESARALLTAFVTANLKENTQADGLAVATQAGTGETTRPRLTPNTFKTINPATGEVLAQLDVDGPAAVDAAVAKALVAQKEMGRNDRHGAGPDPAPRRRHSACS